VRERTRELELANGELQAANKEMESFSYSISHDLRAPVRAVDGFSSLLEKEAGDILPPEPRRYLSLVRMASQQMGRLIDDLLEFVRLGRRPITRSRIDMRALVEECLLALRQEYAGRQVECVLGILPPCEADPALMRQVLLNVIGNAFKFTGRAAQARIETGSSVQEGAIVYYVRDNGVGFDMKYVDKLFGVFQRLVSSEDFEGTGVGLAIVQRIVARHGGRIWVEAAPGRGATFYFTVGGTAGSTAGSASDGTAAPDASGAT
jgi:light-regulated signal transduction histidine kinase (bacteriophytochrome)